VNTSPESGPTGTLADSSNFSGRVWRTTYLEPTEGQRLTGSRFVYEPGARSHWHVHDQEQVIVAIHGHGLVGWQGLDFPVGLSAGD
jgi:quercetin dioxygenase-like cupin family protein